MLSLFVEDLIGLHHVINDIALGDFLRSKLFWSRQVLSVVVSKMVVAHNRHRLRKVIIIISSLNYN